MTTTTTRICGGVCAALLLLAGAAHGAPDQCILDDLIVDGSACIGFDCVCGESFGFDTLRLKENNLRIHFDDTSTAASFPRNDWRITINDSTNGGASFFAVDDASSGRRVFRIDAGTRSNALVVDSGGDVGVGTSTPIGDVHIVTGNTPFLRLEQDGSSGFEPQTWDVAGNETNFFVRDVTNGSALPFRIQPGAASNAVFVNSNARVGLGTSAPGAPLDVRVTGGNQGIGNALLRLERAGSLALQIDDNTGNFWQIAVDASAAGGVGEFRINQEGAPSQRLVLDGNGNLTLAGNCADAAGGGGCTADYVFEPGYELMPLDRVAAFIAENRHLPNVPASEETRAKGLNLNYMNGRLLEKIEELFLYTLAQQRSLDALRERLEALERR